MNRLTLVPLLLTVCVIAQAQTNDDPIGLKQLGLEANVACLEHAKPIDGQEDLSAISPEVAKSATKAVELLAFVRSEDTEYHMTGEQWDGIKHATELIHSIASIQTGMGDSMLCNVLGESIGNINAFFYGGNRNPRYLALTHRQISVCLDAVAASASQLRTAIKPCTDAGKDTNRELGRENRALEAEIRRLQRGGK